MSQKCREGVRPPLAALSHLYKSLLGFENKYGDDRGSPRLWTLEGEAARRYPRVLSSRRCAPSARPQGHAGFARGARLLGGPTRRRVGAGGAAGQGERAAGPAAVRARLPALPGGALVAAPGRARPAVARGIPAGPLLRLGEGGPRAHGRRGRRRGGPGRPMGSGERRQPGTYRRGGATASLGRSRGPCGVRPGREFPALARRFRRCFFRTFKPFPGAKLRAGFSFGVNLRGTSRVPR